MKTIAIGSNVVVVYVMMSTREIAKLKTCHSAKQWVQTLFPSRVFGYFIQLAEIRAKVFWPKNFYSNFKNFEEFRTKKNNFQFLGNSSRILLLSSLQTKFWPHPEKRKKGTITFLYSIFILFIFVVVRLFWWESFHCSRWQLNSSKNSCWNSVLTWISQKLCLIIW